MFTLLHFYRKIIKIILINEYFINKEIILSVITIHLYNNNNNDYFTNGNPIRLIPFNYFA